MFSFSSLSAKIRVVAVAAAAAMAAGCFGGGPPPAPTIPADDTVDLARAEGSIEQYRLGTGDQLRLIVFGEEDLSGEFQIDGSGEISLPLIREIEAAGKTTRELQNAIEARLREGYLNDPRVNVEVTNYRPYYILGEVEDAGEYPFQDGLTVLNAVATAGGFTYRADTRRVFIRRGGQPGGEREFRLDPETRVLPGDTIRIAERFF